MKKLLTQNDFLASLSLLLVSLPLSAGIAVASGAPPEAGILSAIFGALFFGLLSSSPLAVFGPAAGLSIFLAYPVSSQIVSSHTSAAVTLAGLFLILLSFIDIYKIVNIFPRSVMKAMVAGIGLILILKMIPHLLGYDRHSLFDEEFSHGKDNTLIDIWNGLETFHMGTLTISLVSFVLLFFLYLLQKKNKISSRISIGFMIVLIGVCLNLLLREYFPAWQVSGEHLLHVSSTRVRFKPFFPDFSNIFEISLSALIITAVIVLEGFITLDIFQKVDPYHSRVNYKRETVLLGIGNCLMGLIGALPIMPVLIRSTSNVNFGAQTRSSVVLHGCWLILAIKFQEIFGFIPMASVAVILFVIGIRLLDFNEMKKMIKNGADHWLPYFLTIGFILFFDLLWGIGVGFVMGIILSLRSSFQRSMVLVHDHESYLLKFHKDVTFFHKAELRELLESIPEDKEVLIDGTGNIFIDKEIEEWLLDYAQESIERGTNVSFIKSPLAVSLIFKES